MTAAAAAAPEPAPAPPATAAPSPLERALAWLTPERAFWIAAALLLVDAVDVLARFGTQFTDEDQAVFWTAAYNYAHLQFHEPCFYGQAYNTLWESLPAGLLTWVGLSPIYGVPLVAIAAGLAPWVLIADRFRRLGQYAPALLALGAPLFFPIRYACLLSLAGFNGGVFFGAVGLALMLRARVRWFHALIAGFLATFSLWINPNSIILLAPAAVYLLGQRELWKVVPFGAIGAVPGYYVDDLAKRFYTTHPNWWLHRGDPLKWEAHDVKDGMEHLARHFDSVVPANPLGPYLIVVILGAIIVWSLWRKQWGLAACCALGLWLLRYSLGYNKVHDGSDSVFFAFERMFLAAPLLVAFALLFMQRHRRAPALSLLAILGVLGVVEAVRLYEMPDEAQALGSVKPSMVLPLPVSKVLDDCQNIRVDAARAGAHIVAALDSRADAYGCSGVLHGDVDVIYPFYERRTWLLQEAAQTRGQPLVLTDVPADICQRLARSGLGCQMLGERPRAAAIQAPPNVDDVSLLRGIGLRVRPF